MIVFQNDIPVFSPALTDGSLGDMIYFHSYKNPGLVLDIVEGESPKMWCERNLKTILQISFHFVIRYSEVEQQGRVCQDHRDDHPRRRSRQASRLQR